MSDELRNKGKGFAKFLESLSEDEIIKANEEQLRSAQEEHERFREMYTTGVCYLCNKELTSFSRKSPCIHWLLKPKGFKKKDIKAISEKYGLLQIQSLLRWYANEDAFAKNINDLTEEGTGSKLVELTIKYRNLEWSFSCAESDYMGHETSQHSKYPHYHFQMRVDKRPFINFNDFHLPLNEMDVINISAKRESPDFIKHKNSFGEGMSDIFDKEVIEQVLSSSTPEENNDNATFSVDSLVMADDGESIKGEELDNIIQEAKEKGVTVASLLHKLPNSKAQVMVGPGPGVVEQAPRKPRKKK